LKEHVRAEGNKVLIGVKSRDLERTLAQEIDYGAVDEEDHGEGQAGVETRPPVEEALGLAEAGLEKSIIPEEDLQATSCPTEALLVEIMDSLRGETIGKVLVDILGTVAAEHITHVCSRV